MSERREWWPLALALALLAAYGWVLVQPAQVGARYRLYFIDRAVAAWQGGRDSIYALGTELDFRQAQQVLSVDGWSVPEPQGTWTNGQRAQLTLHIERTARPRELRLQLVPFVAPHLGLDAQTLDLHINGLLVGEWVLKGPQTLHIALPAALTQKHGGQLRMALRLPQAMSPRALGLAPDRRDLAVQFQSLQLN